MVDVIQRDEAEPNDYPNPPSELSTAAAALPAAMVWSRIEDWIAYRWGERSCTWLINGPGMWVPRLRPLADVQFERWADSWEPVSPTKVAYGYELDAATYQVTATVGTSDPPPATVLEAYARLAEYMAHLRDEPSPGATSVTDGDYSVTRSANATARAMQYSGAADLLRGYRR